MTVNVKDFGALGNGTTNDTAAIQAAVNSLAAKGGGTVFFPEGTYNVNTLNLNVRGVKLQGSGWLGTRIQGMVPNTKIINISADFCGVESLQVGFYGYTPDTVTSIGIYSNANNCVFSDFRVYSTGVGIYLDNSTICMMNNFYIETFSQAGIYMNHWVDMYAHNFVIQASVGKQYGKLACMYVTNGCDAILMSGGDILSGRHSIQCEGAAWGMNYSNFTNICFDTSYESCASLERSRMNRFTNCWFSGGRDTTGFEGMIIGNSTDTEFVSCQFTNNGGHGASVKDNNTNVRFNSCLFDSNSYTGGPNYFHGLSIWPNAKNFSVTNCTFKNGSFAGQQGFGLLINYGTSDRYIITNNFFQNNGILGLSDGGTGTTKVVNGNI